VPGQKSKEIRTEAAPNACMVLAAVIALDFAVTCRPKRSESPIRSAAKIPKIAPIMFEEDA
tara:strand:- start:712 stop:894 length:183 start_codon:yes stop_codon:yes gene_type:complete